MKIVYFSTNLAREPGGVESSDAPNSTLAGEQRPPKSGLTDTIRRYYANSSHDYSPRRPHPISPQRQGR
jgi:hypothetical protein